MRKNTCGGSIHVVVVVVVVLVVAFAVDVALSLWWKIESKMIIAGKGFLVESVVVVVAVVVGICRSCRPPLMAVLPRLPGGEARLSVDVCQLQHIPVVDVAAVVVVVVVFVVVVVVV